MTHPFATVRKEYATQGLTEADLASDPFAQFEKWYHDAVAANVIEPNAMTLATATLDGRPSARVVLLKAFDTNGFVFFTNYESQKGQELAQNPQAALAFYWATLERQIRLVGSITKTSREEAALYFKSRPIGAQLGAWVSQQSQVIPNREVLEQKMAALAAEYGDKEIPVPAHWGGYRLAPTEFEFWQGRLNRLHDRFRYTRLNEAWQIARLAP